MRTDRADRDRPAASTSEVSKRNHYARPGQGSIDERSYKLATLTVEALGASGRKAATWSIRWWPASSKGPKIATIAEKRLQETPIPDHLCGHPGPDFTPSE